MDERKDPTNRISFDDEKRLFFDPIEQKNVRWLTNILMHLLSFNKFVNRIDEGKKSKRKDNKNKHQLLVHQLFALVTLRTNTCLYRQI